MRSIALSPSVLASNFQFLGAQVNEAIEAGAEMIHIDVMDGRFVPNISIGIPIVEAIAPLTRSAGILCDVHLMIVEPEKYVSDFTRAGANLLTVHVEASPHLHRTIQQIKESGIQSGVAINPGTSLTAIEEVLGDVDVVLVMSVNPGFGGQSYIPAVTKKIERLAQMIAHQGLQTKIEVDGGVKINNTSEIVAAGADILVAGSAIFNQQRPIVENINALRRAAAAGLSTTI